MAAKRRTEELSPGSSRSGSTGFVAEAPVAAGLPAAAARKLSETGANLSLHQRGAAAAGSWQRGAAPVDQAPKPREGSMCRRRGVEVEDDARAPLCACVSG
jgi:hypothetical protein